MANTALDQQITALKASANANKTAADSAITVLNSIKQLIADAVAAALALGATAEQLQAITDVGAALDNETAAIATAVAANTPSPTPPALASKKPK